MNRLRNCAQPLLRSFAYAHNRDNFVDRITRPRSRMGHINVVAYVSISRDVTWANHSRANVVSFFCLYRSIYLSFFLTLSLPSRLNNPSYPTRQVSQVEDSRGREDAVHGSSIHGRRKQKDTLARRGATRTGNSNAEFRRLLARELVEGRCERGSRASCFF